MKICIQWATDPPMGFIEYDLSDWLDIPRRPLPVGGESIDGEFGLFNGIRIQGVGGSGWDHASIVALPVGGCRATFWKDDPDDYPGGGDFLARVIDFLLYAPDPSAGGAINTRQSQVVYAGPDAYARIAAIGPVQGQILKPWVDFIPPGGEIHGVWTTDSLHEALFNAQVGYGWRDWGEAGDGVGPPVPEQRPLGRYRKSAGTKTFFKRDTARTNTIDGATDELASETAAGAGEQNGELIDGGADETIMVWSTPSGEPGVAWPTDVTGSLDVAVGGTDIGYGFRTAGGATGHISRVNSGLTAHVGAAKEMSEDLFTGSGIKTYTVSGSWPAGDDANDRLEAVLAGTRAVNHGNQGVTVDMTADSFTTGGWVVAAVSGPKPGSINLVGAGR